MTSTLKCETCTLRFDRPMLLPCGFTSCLRCLRRLASEHPTYIMCPDCLKKHEVPDGASVESFPVNKLILDLLERRISIGGAADSTTTAGPPRRSAPAPPVKTREIEICSKCANKTASFERCAHCSAVFCIFCFEKHIETISEEVHNYVSAVEEHCAAAAQVVDFYSKLSTGMGALAEREKRKEAVIEWGEQLKSLFIRAVGTRVGQLCGQVDTMIDLQASKMTSLDDAATKVKNIQTRCKSIGEELRSSVRPNVPSIFQTCAQVDEQIRSLEQSIDGLGMPYLDNDAVAGDTQRVLEEIKQLGRLVCDSKRTIQDIVAAQSASVVEDAGSSDDGILDTIREQPEPASWYDRLSTPAFSVSQDALSKPFGPIWDMCAFTSPDNSVRYAVIAHNKMFATVIDATNGTSLVTYDLSPPEDLPDLKLDIKHTAASAVKRQIYFSQSDKNGIFALQLPNAVAKNGSLNEVQLTLAVRGPGDSYFCGLAVDDRSKLIYTCDQFRSRVVAWSLENDQLMAAFPIAGSSLNFDFKPFKCSLSHVRSNVGVLLAVSDLTNERVCILALSSPTTGQYLPNAVISRGTVYKPCGMSFDAASHLLVVEGPRKIVQVFNIVPDCQSMAAFPSNSDKMRSPRAVSVFLFGPKLDRQVVAVADNAANIVFFYKFSD